MPKPKKSTPLTKEQFLDRMMRREPNLERAVGELVEQLHAYEKKYRMRSEVFFKLIVGTPAEDQEDFLDWAMCYRGYLQVFQSQVMPGSATADVIG